MTLDVVIYFFFLCIYMHCVHHRANIISKFVCLVGFSFLGIISLDMSGPIDSHKSGLILSLILASLYDLHSFEMCFVH